MATPLRDLSYRYPWLYQAIAKTTALAVGGHDRFHRLPLQDLEIQKNARILDLCCGRGEATEVLLDYSDNVTGVDASPKAIAFARKTVSAATYVEGWAQDLPFESEQFDLVHSSAAMHEMTAEVLTQIFKETFRVLKPGGTFAIVDFHHPTTPLMWPGLATFLWLFETETSWRMISEDLSEQLTAIGFSRVEQTLHAGGSLQVIQAQK